MNLMLSMLFFFFAWEMDVIERVFTFIAINGGYHMYYWFFKSTSTIMGRTNDRFGRSFERFGNKFFSIFGMVAGFFMAVSFISESILLSEYHQLFALCVPIGLFFRRLFILG
ncbi:hypothetical protein ACFO3O_03785 [Dokdonia ponticola]|uniref:Uncharacterized protein n=1 Tax=Dokdonia ponticola TaxID=2041041 RepID=A0ABV9HS60_9FLAO